MSRTCISLAFALGLAAAAPAQVPFAGPEVDAAIRKGLATTVWVNEPKQLPPGVLHRTYYSASMKHDVGYCIYLPPDYAASSARYPVIYNLHGAGGNELHGFEEAALLDQGIRSGKWPPMILVMPNGGKTTFYKDSYDGRYMGETNIIRELIPHIDRTYRSIAAREGRAIEGFSMGGRGSTRLAIKYPDLFCSLFAQAGNVPHILQAYDPAHPDTYPNFYLGPDQSRYADNDVYELLKKNLAKIKGRLRIQVWCGTRDEGHLPTVREFHAALVAAGVDHTYMEIEGLAHDRSAMLNRYRQIWFDYHAESFRRIK